MSEGWSKEELLASVVACIEMQRKERKGQPFIKKHYYEDLAAEFDLRPKGGSVAHPGCQNWTLITPETWSLLHAVLHTK